MRDVPSDRPALRAAVGELAGLSAATRAAFEAGLADFGPLRVAGPGDWLAHHAEARQTVEAFVRAAPNRPGADGRDRLYVVPLGPVPMVEELAAYARDYFTVPVSVLPVLDLAALPLTRRMNSGHIQILAGDLQAELQRRLPADAYALIGLTMQDLYPGESWNYVFGLASMTKRTGVFSFARYDPRFHDPEAAPQPAMFEQRAIKILSHEVGHMFGISHCVHALCVMNGINHIDELDGSPPALCPVCLRKFHLVAGFDPAQRYRKLHARYRDMRWDQAATFVETRIAAARANVENP